MSKARRDSGDGGPENVTWCPSAGHLMTPARQEHNELPWVDPTILDGLEKQVANPDIAWRFARDYANMWARRQGALMAAVERQDRDAALDAALSLKNSSMMVGGLRLARVVQTLENAIRTGDALDGQLALLEIVTQHGAATVCELQHSYIGKARL